jgi:sodium transport system permease protein
MNYFERQTLIVKAPPDDFEALIKASKFNDAVIVIEPDFEPKLASADVPTVEIISNSANSRMSGAQRRVSRLMQGFSQEQQGQRMTSRGLSPAALETIDVQERDLASLGARSAQFMSMVPFFLIMAVLYGAMTAALDTTAGERERGSLEPLLMNPVAREDLVVGKWGAVVTVGMLIALLSCLSFIPTQAFLRSETLAAMFQFGWREFALFLFILLPFAAALSALMMAISIRSKSFKEAQSSNTVVIMGVTLLPVMQLFGQQGDTPWHNYVPALAQISLMNRVLRGDSLPLVDLLIPLVVGVLVAIACLTYVARSLNQSAIR